MKRFVLTVMCVMGIFAFPTVGFAVDAEGTATSATQDGTSDVPPEPTQSGDLEEAGGAAGEAPSPQEETRQGAEDATAESRPVSTAASDSTVEPAESDPTVDPTVDTLAAERAKDMPGNQRITWEMRRQVPFVRNGGMLNRKETAVVAYVDGDLFPPAVMVGILRGINYWLSVGLDVGGDMGVFQALLRIKQEMGRTRRTNFFFWGWHVRTGYKYVNVDFTDTLSDVWRFDDNSWILTFENTLGVRFGKHRRRGLYLNTIIYGDFDLRGQGRQIDVYVYPATLGFETILGRNWNFFLELGVIISINGWEVANDVVISENGDIFPSGGFGFAYRFGGVRTALPENWRDPDASPMR